jgi:hypothetical protein
LAIKMNPIVVLDCSLREWPVAVWAAWASTCSISRRCRQTKTFKLFVFCPAREDELLDCVGVMPEVEFDEDD